MILEAGYFETFPGPGCDPPLFQLETAVSVDIPAGMPFHPVLRKGDGPLRSFARDGFFKPPFSFSENRLFPGPIKRVLPANRNRSTYSKWSSFFSGVLLAPFLRVDGAEKAILPPQGRIRGACDEYRHFFVPEASLADPSP